ncbi:MAG: hypothetical protein J0L73_26275 [Verrucomicrobia bacterium]|nr:hypothetical protein [Verrucomicrobiota bacterium]
MNPKKLTNIKKSAQTLAGNALPPPSIPGLFHFKWQINGSYAAELEPELHQRLVELRTNAKLDDQDLAWALDISSKIPSQGLDYLVNKNAWLMLAMSDDDCENEFGKRVDPESRGSQMSVMAQCCRVVLEMQRTIGSPLTLLMDETKTNSQRDAASKLVMSKFRKSLSIIQNQRTAHKKATHVTRTRPDGSTFMIPLTVAAIEVAQDLATGILPFKIEVQRTLEEKYKSDLVTIRDQSNRATINWSDVFERAGLKRLPVEP